MNYSQRKDSILSMLRVAEELSIRQLTDMTGASDATIRRDLARMEQEGCVRRSWGGVCRPDTPENTRRSSLQRQTLSSAHEVIGKAAASFLKDEELIFIGSGTTTLAMIPIFKTSEFTSLPTEFLNWRPSRRRGSRLCCCAASSRNTPGPWWERKP